MLKKWRGNKWKLNNFIEPIDKIMLINKINLPDEIIYELKDYIFYNMTKMNFIKEMSIKKGMINILIQNACSRKLGYDQNMQTGFKDSAEECEKMEIWTLGFPIWNYWANETTVLRGSNCKKCGEYEYICIEKYKNIPSNIKLCDC
tara:strand:- start:567 stop:1004 length:438 start_codon:yes stop_codon:yes gene_type:complete